jgi:RimJ/RimL family protein N-acetyltransferase
MNVSMKSMDIETRRLRIRNLMLSDVGDFHSYRSDPSVTKFQSFDTLSVEQARAFIEENATISYELGGEWKQFGIENKIERKLIGDVAIKLDRLDIRLAEIGITISPGAQLRGYGKETLQAILTFLFSQIACHRVAAIVDVDNTSSIHLIESLGFRREGFFVDSVFLKGKWTSEFHYAMLKSEWEKKPNS